MHIITHTRIVAACEKWPQAASALDGWYRTMKKNEPTDFASLKQLFPAVDKVGDLYVFDIGGNKLRLIARVLFQARRVYIRTVLTHKEYDKGDWKEDKDHEYRSKTSH
ncbi:MAG: type II toxin-antitoxin system HigB family toxin [Agitococcus sp.]|jgi:mRNA interferase HigB|nr:type II toxin-antitoxin system HigB family toxin [Moraxellaceae bacterium]MBK9185229.1 type II toxin-antitoxin system HigB family toxin [Moraxellaceae bacterium]MBP9216198.1 type II toxin-antitoxin system HigB family toxin [Agitococcus sp.]